MFNAIQNGVCMDRSPWFRHMTAHISYLGKKFIVYLSVKQRCMCFPKTENLLTCFHFNYF